ncbi:MAG: hypothetical protein L3K02_04150 [Thermoplasmata archaeon]|nr:hypothetical protein [Thermoplasmata archaeon]
MAFAILVTFATYVYLSTLLAIPVILLVGLAVPIWLGVKRLRTLAIFGLVILLLVAPLATIIITQDVRTPIPLVDSPVLPGTSGSILQNASVTPYLGTTSTNFTWTVNVVPSFIPKGNSTPYWIVLYLSTCPGATATNDPNCAAGYPFWALNDSFLPNQTAPVTMTFHFTFPSDSIWAWQMGLFIRNLSQQPGTNQSFNFILLAGDPVYNGIEGPVTGDFVSTYSQLLLTVYLNDLIYLGVPYFVVLLVYGYITRRKSSRADMINRAAGPTPTDAPGDPGPGVRSTDSPATLAKRPAAAPRRPEMNCPNCGAVVYANETTCWKCGTAITNPPANAPLPSDSTPK